MTDAELVAECWPAGERERRAPHLVRLLADNWYESRGFDLPAAEGGDCDNLQIR